MKKIILIDGHALIFKMYYAFLRRPMINSKGVDTSILFGFTKTILELLVKERPTHFGVAFDPPSKTFRHHIFPEYKANRSETPELIKSALQPLCELLEAISVPVLMKDGYEADDVIGTFAKKAEKEGHTVYMVTPDKDYGQLVSDNIFQYKPGKSGSPDEILGKDEICGMYGIEDPKQVIDILTIWGDSSDNIPGVKGVGEVGAKKLVAKFKSVSNIYQNLDQLPPKQQAAFKDASQYIDLSKKLVTIDTSVQLEWNEKMLELHTPDFSKISKLFQQYEFSSLLRMLPQMEQLFTVNNSVKQGIITTNTIESKASKEIPWSISTDQDVAKSALEKNYLCFSIKDNLLFTGCEPFVTSSNGPLSSTLKGLFSNSSILKTGYDIKSLATLLEKQSCKLEGYLSDTELMHYVLMPERSHKLEALAQGYLNQTLNPQDIPSDLFSPEPKEDIRQQVCKELPVVAKLSTVLEKEMEKESVKELYDKIEMPLIKILSSMERTGVKLDVVLLDKYSKELSMELCDIENQVRELANEPNLNISSPKQLGVILYEKLKLVKNAKKTSKKNYSTDEETLTSILDAHPIIPLILEYRNIKKLLSTYIDPLPSLVSPETGKIHTTYNQSLTSTGRLSSIKPNLQNIPIRTERGREIRKAFIPSDPKGVIMSADYSQIELRLMAHMSQDPHFVEAFKSGKDIHAATASKIFGVTEEELTREQRNRAKVANFGIIYGISAFGLSQRLAIPRSESKQLIDEYFANYPRVEEYMKSMIAKAQQDGFVTTLYGRKRYLPDINSKNPVVRGLAERNAINAPIQGSAADIIKVAMINVASRLKEEGFKSKMVLQVHDELVFDVYPGESELLSQLVKQQMEGVIELSVPLTVECSWGANWLEAH